MPTIADQQTEQETVTFIAKVRELRLVRSPGFRKVNDIGQSEQIKGVAYQFEDGVFRTDDPDILAWLRAHSAYHVDFHEKGAEPDRIPDSSGVLGEVSEAAVAGDLKALQDILAVEQDGHQRPDVLSAAGAAVEALEKKRG